MTAQSQRELEEMGRETLTEDSYDFRDLHTAYGRTER
jgi:hypothetical protein